uniref:Peptidase S1 domain-containing protein n=1 Tax=Panagrolaimus davidi TaxID=227884 RepID=A0A914QCA5_9BILA
MPGYDLSILYLSKISDFFHWYVEEIGISLAASTVGDTCLIYGFGRTDDEEKANKLLKGETVLRENPNDELVFRGNQGAAPGDSGGAVGIIFFGQKAPAILYKTSAVNLNHPPVRQWLHDNLPNIFK